MTHERFESPIHFDMALQDPIFYMMRKGIKIDREVQRELSASLHLQWEKAQKSLDAIAGTHVNCNSPKQMKWWLYGELKLPRRTKKGKLTTDEDALRSLLAICEDKLVKLKTQSAKFRWMRGHLSILMILKIREIRKKLSSYIDITPDPDGRMRTLFKVGGTETGRLSANKTLWDTGLNLMTVPRSLRHMYIADDGKEMCELDLNRGESWIYAHLSEDPEMMRIHTSGGDFHSETAVAIASAFGTQIHSLDEFKALEEADPEKHYKLRFVGKKTNHASAYRMGSYRMSQVVNEEADDTGITITVGQAKGAQDLWIGKYPGMKSWWDGIEQQLNETRTLTTPYGRTRTFYGFWSDHLFKEATAYVPQSTSADYLNLGMLDVYHDLVLPGVCGLELLHNNHDSLVVQYDEGKRNEIIPQIIEKLTRSIVVNGYEITIPIEAQYGQNWKETKLWTNA